MSNYDVNVNFKVNSTGLDKAKQSADKLKDNLKQAEREAGTFTNRIENLKGKLAGLAIGTAIVGTFAAIVKATIDAEKATAQLEARLKSTGNASAQTTKQMLDLADALMGKSIFDDEAIVGAETMLLQFRRIGGEVFPQATKAVLDFATAMGTDLDSAAKKVGKALNDPIAGMKGLSKAGVDFTEEQEKLVKKFVEVGDLASAQKIILDELEKSMGGAAEAARNTLGGALTGLKNSFANLLEGDSGDAGTKGVTKSINDLTDTLNDPDVKEGFQAMANTALGAAGAIAQLISGTNKLFGEAQKWLNWKVGGTRNVGDTDQIEYDFKKATEALDRYDTKDQFEGYFERKAKADLERVKKLREENRFLFGEPSGNKTESGLPKVTLATSGNGVAGTTESDEEAKAKAKAAREAARHQEEYNRLLERTKNISASIAADNVTDGFASAIEQSTTPQLIEQFEAAAAAAKQVGLVVDGWSVSADGTSVVLQTLVGPEMEKIAQAAGKTTDELKKQGDAAVREAEARAKANKEAQASLDVQQQLKRLTEKAAVDIEVVAEIQAGRIYNEAQLANYLEDQAFNAELLKKQMAGVADEELRRLRTAHEQDRRNEEDIALAKDKTFGDAEDAKQFWQNTSNSFVDMFVDGLARGKLAWREWLQSLAQDLLKSYLLKLLAQYLPMIGGGVNSTTTGTVNNGAQYANYAANGAWFDGARQYFANGGVVNRATQFGMMNGKTGVMGEAGPEAIMPLTRGPNGKLGVSAHGGGGTQVVNLGNTTINVQSTSDSARDDRETARAIDRMLEEKMARFLAEQRRSGNTLNQNFGYRY